MITSRMSLAGLLFTTMGCASAPALPSSSTSAAFDYAEPAIRLADAVMQRNPQVHHRWDYVAGLVLQAIDDVGVATGDSRYSDYVQRNMNVWVQPDGSITGYRPAEYNIDHINQGKVLFGLMARTSDPRYRAATELLRDQMRSHPRTREGGFWHKNIYPHQMWLDGLYMAAPFLAEYASRFGEPAIHDDVTHQILLIARHTRDPRTGLYYHAWDESRGMPWADPLTGLSANFWGRAMGWYAMAIVDVLDHLPADHRDRPEIVRIFQEMAHAVANVQDPVTGLWYQVMDQPNREGNYHETSASSMFAYALAKGVRLGVLEPRYTRVAARGYESLVRTQLRTDTDRLPSLHGIVEVAGLGGPRGRDGSFEYYMSEPVVANDYKGVGPFIMAGLELAKLHAR
jgi:unsaturated rhamnogalacturonyl hydrolase